MTPYRQGPSIHVFGKQLSSPQAGSRELIVSLVEEGVSMDYGEKVAH